MPWYSPSAGHVADREHGLSPDTRQVLDLARIRDRSVATMRRARNRTRGLGRAVQGTSGVRLPGRRVHEPRPPAPDRDTGQRKITARQDRVPRSTFRVLVEMLCVMSAGGTCSSATPPSCRDCRPAAPSWQQRGGGGARRGCRGGHAHFSRLRDRARPRLADGVRAADVYVALVGIRYGTPVPSGPELSNTGLSSKAVSGRRSFLVGAEPPSGTYAAAPNGRRPWTHRSHGARRSLHGPATSVHQALQKPPTSRGGTSGRRGGLTRRS